MNKADNDILVEKLVTSHTLARQQIHSFNYFISEEIKSIVKANEVIDSDIDHDFYLKYLDIRVNSPTIEENMLAYDVLPNECRLRDLTYAGNIYVDIEYIKSKKVIRKKNVLIGRIPIMLRSDKCHLSADKDNHEVDKIINIKSIAEKKECPYDMGGYFIVKGVERVILIQEQLSKNRIILDVDNKNCNIVSVTSSTHDKKSKTYVYLKKNIIKLKTNVFTEDINVIIILKALGLVSDREIVEFVGIEDNLIDLLEYSVEEAIKANVLSKRQAVEYISKYIKVRPNTCKIEETLTVLSEVILPNIPKENTDMRRKAITICIMVRRLLQAQIGALGPDDIDFLGNKRFELSGNLISILFEDTFLRFNSELKKSIDKVLSKQQRAQEFDAMTFLNLQVNLISSSFIKAISTGNWTVKRFKMERAGVTQVLNRLSYISMIGMMTKVQSQFEKTRKVSGPRSLHTSSFGMLCPADTPEGESCGLVKNLALLAEISPECDSSSIEDILYSMGVKDYRICNGVDLYKDDNYVVFLNGTIVGAIGTPKILLKRFREIRRNGKIDKFVSIYKNDEKRIVEISTDNGRICRPLLIVDDKISQLKPRDLDLLRKNLKTVEDLFSERKIEFLDVNEENDMLISKPEDIFCDDTTHVEICKYGVLGYVAGLIPFPHHNQSPRNTYQCAMGKQAVGTIAINQLKRYDNLLNLLVYPQKPLVSTKILKLINYEELPAGQNAMVLVMSYSGYDIEDALILNKNSIDRGFGRCEIYKSHKHILKRYGNGSQDRITGCGKSDGIKGPGSKLSNGDFFVRKESPVNESEFKFSGEYYKNLEPCIVDKVLITKSGEDLFMVKTSLRQMRTPEIGDKYSSRHGQKGVIGLIVPQEDLPFSENGITPDIIMNPHGFPSRMTVGKIIELIAGKSAALSGIQSDSTVFCDDKTDFFSNVLIENGFSYCGKDTFTSGITGEVLEGYVFFGPIYYQKLKHMVADKMHARGRGPRAMLTRQPTEGRSKDGGLRLGEMERDCLISYGTSSVLIERLMISSDVFKANVCYRCGIIVSLDSCDVCKGSEIVCIDMPYACKLLFQELMSMNILPRITFK